MPRYEVTFNSPSAGEGTLVQVPLLHKEMKSGDTVSVFLSEDDAKLLEANPSFKVKKVKEPTVDEMQKVIDKIKTPEELDDLFVGEERESVIAALTARRVALAEDAETPEEVTEPEPEGGAN